MDITTTTTTTTIGWSMRTSSWTLATINRIGFIILGLTNNFAYAIMLSAAYDLLKQNDPNDDTFPVNPLMASTPTTTITTATATTAPTSIFSNTTTTTSLPSPTSSSSSSSAAAAASFATAATLLAPAAVASGQTILLPVLGKKPFCNQHSTSTVLLADSLPSLTTKLIYPFLLVGLATKYKAIATALLSAASFLITGLASTKWIIFAGVACASFACGLGETTYLSNAPRYGDVAISGWSIGTGASGLLAAMAYALLRIVLSIKAIMLMMLIGPILMLVAYFYVIKPTESPISEPGHLEPRIEYQTSKQNNKKPSISVSTISTSSDEDQNKPFIWISSHENNDTKSPVRVYGSYEGEKTEIEQQQQQQQQQQQRRRRETQFNYREKIRFLPKLMKYFLPLFLVYYAEFFINQGLHELIYYPEVTFLDHAAQYRWFQVSYQLGVMISRSSLDFFVLNYLWTMSLLQLLNALIFYAHAAKWIFIPNFYLTLAIIIYEGLLGGFTYANTFYCMKKELARNRQEFGISTVVIADTLGIVLAGSTAIPVHDSLCKLYT